jgi:hypothetical protein
MFRATAPAISRFAAIVKDVELYEECGRAACYEARSCRSRSVACFDEMRGTVISLMLETLYEGYLDDPEYL